MLAQEYRFICCQQKELYEYAYNKGADITKFSNDFLNSTFCNSSLDKPYSIDQYKDIVNWIEFLKKEGCHIVPATDQENNISHDAAGWIGFTYRYLHFVTGLSSSELSQKVPIDRLIISYPGLHTVDEDMSADIIIHDFELPKKENKYNDMDMK